jgi:hypothetical protein
MRSGLTFQGRNPDVLTCIANLSNDEVFTPPELANQMLDTVEQAWAEANGGASTWADPTVRFLDPFTKSGVFLREITKRLVDGPAEEIPDLNERVDHILTKQLYGIAITELTSLLARRISGGRLWLAVGQQGSDVQNREAWIGAVEPDRRIVIVQGPLIKCLGVLRYRGWRCANHMWKDGIKCERSLVRKIVDVLVKVTVVDRKEPDMVLLKAHPMREVQRSNRVVRLVTLVLDIPRVPLQSDTLQT